MRWSKDIGSSTRRQVATGFTRFKPATPVVRESTYAYRKTDTRSGPVYMPGTIPRTVKDVLEPSTVPTVRQEKRRRAKESSLRRRGIRLRGRRIF